jgi:hypothetical protein
MFMLLSCQAAGKRENEPSWRVYFISELGIINIVRNKKANPCWPFGWLFYYLRH